MKNQMRIILVAALILTGADGAMAETTTWDYDGEVTFCDPTACGFGGVTIGDNFSGFINANSAPNSTIGINDITGFLVILGGLSADSQDGIVLLADVQTDANGDFETGTLVLRGTISGFNLDLTFNITDGIWMIETNFPGFGLITSGTGSWGFEFDGDGLGAIVDNCIEKFNPDQRDTDLDGFGNACDPDFDQNCSVNFFDLLNMRDNIFTLGDLDTDLDGDGNTNFNDLLIMQGLVFGPPGPSGIPNICD